MIIHYHIIEYHIILHIVHTSLLWFDLESKEHSLEMSPSSLCCFDAFSCELILVLKKTHWNMCFKAEATWHPFGSSSNAWSRWDQGLQPWSASQFQFLMWIHWVMRSHTVDDGLMDHMNSWKALNLLGKGEAMLSQWNVQPASESQVSWSIHFADEWNCMKSFFFGFRHEQAAFSSHVSQQIRMCKNMQQERCIKFGIAFQQCQTLHQGKMRDVAESVSRSTDALLALPHWELKQIGGVLPQTANWAYQETANMDLYCILHVHIYTH